MRSRVLFLAVSAALVAGSAATALADDGERLFRQLSSPPGQVGSPEPEGEHAFVNLMDFYVPAQAADGTLLSETTAGGIEYYDIEGNLVKTEPNAKPLLSFFIYGPVITFDDPSTSGFPGHGRRDAFAAVSLDDGATWKRTNLSNSADQSSFTTTTFIQDPAVPAPTFEVTSDTPVTTSALFAERGQSGRGSLTVDGIDAIAKSDVEIRNAVTFEVLGTVKAKNDGSFTFRLEDPAEVPCSVQAGYTDGNVWGPYIHVTGAELGTCVGADEVTVTNAYPGDVTNGTFAVAGNRVLAAWQSKFCQGGFPAWSDAYPVDVVASYLGIDVTADLYLTDLFVVSGNQASVDYREQEEFPGEYDDIGEVPFNCLWSARGVLREDPDNLGTTEVVWFQAERLTSGRRDVNRIEVACTAGAGCAVTWQEDPGGLRPGEGEGAGTGWAGATTNSQTDVWYSFIHWLDFDIVDNSGSFAPLADLSDTALGTNRPQPAVPMMIPVRLTNNARCQDPATNPDTVAPYCNDAVAGTYGIKDQCIDTVDIPLGPQGELQPICVADTNGNGTGDLGDTPNVANTASSRPRLNLQPRDSDGNGVTDDAWVIVFAEEDKGLGRFGFDTTMSWTLGDLTDVGEPCGDPDASQDDDCFEADIGKNIMWFSFAMGTPQTSTLDGGSASGKDFSLVNNLLVQGAQLNQPEVNWRTGTFYPPMSTADMWNFGGTDDGTGNITGGYNYLIFNSEIARRSSLMTQSVAKATTNATSGLVAFPLWKQGTVRQGGPADIMARRFVIDPGAVDQADTNPYDFANMACQYTDDAGAVVEGVMLFTDGTNPQYPKGLCMAPAINLSGRTPFLCDTGGSSQADGVCPGEAMVCTEVTGYGQLCSADATTPVPLDSLENPENIQVFDKLLSFYECPGWNGVDVSNGGNTGDSTIPAECGTELVSAILQNNQNDQSWYMPLEISKAHRGFLDGDFVMTMYAWSPNYKDNAVGRDRYELYARRSFDGGMTWTTTPSSFLASDGLAYSASGTTTCETWRDGADSTTDSHICTLYGAGDLEQSRNMSQLTSNRFTILDPRYTPTRGSMATTGDVEWAIYSPVDPTDIRNPSRFFIVYEDGDNTTTAVGEAEPLDLAYGRGEVFGDHYTVWSEIDTGVSDPVLDCYPSNTYGDTAVAWAEGTGFCNEFDGLEERQDDRSEEASITSSAYGDFLYGVWGQFTVDDAGEFVESDAVFRRVWYLDDYICDFNADPTCAYDVVGQGQQ